MNWILILPPALAWLLAATWGRRLLRASPEQLWQSTQLNTSPLPYDPNRREHRLAIGIMRFQGWTVLAAAVTFTLMAILVAAGVVPFARH